MIRIFGLLIPICFVVGTLCARADEGFPFSHFPAQVVIDDMTRDGDALPVGLNTKINWARHGRVNLGNRPGTFSTILPWGQIMAGPGNSADHADIEIRNFVLIGLYNNENTFRLITVSRCVNGAIFPIDYKENRHSSLTISRGPGKCELTAVSGGATHFWSDAGRVEFEKNGLQGFVTLVEARLSPTAPPDSRFLMSAGADYWLSKQAKWDHFKTNGDAAIGRFSWLTPEWKYYSMTTIPIGILKTLEGRMK